MVSVSSTLTTSGFRPTLRDTSRSAAAKPVPKPAGLFRRIVEAIIASNQRRADREIARWIALRGGKLTDSLERQMERRFVRGESDRDLR